MWGARIFEEAQTAAVRRNLRGTRRRLGRRKERINILQSLMLDDIEKEYPNFIPLLKESSLDYEDKKIAQPILGRKYNLFSDNKNTDTSFFKEFPTIYHLRNYLINSTERADIRLIYLALHHIIKYRGNFLYEEEFLGNFNQIEENINQILNFLKNQYDITLNADNEEIINILKQKNMSKTNKKEELIKLFNFDKIEKQIIVNLINLLLGYKSDINIIFETDIDKSRISFATDIENEDEIKEALQEYSGVFENMKNVYNWTIIQDILKGETYISTAMIKKYKKYQEDLKQLKRIYKKYFQNEYSNMFRREGKDNYVAYNGKSAGKKYSKCKPELFFANLKKKINSLPENCAEKKEIIKRLEENDYLVKINVTDNGAIPHQLHLRELKEILENQSKYYKTLEENKDKIIKLFSFRIPYYIGPLSIRKGQNHWIVKKENQKIRPWNFDQIVDIDATAEAFIKRMTNKCTYLINEDVIPKQSILYSKFCVLNELNNIRIDGHHLGKDEKKDIIEKLFKTKKKVTAKLIKNYYKVNGKEIKTITGLTDNDNFNSSMASYIEIKEILGKIDENNIEECEDLIYWITIFEDREILKRKIKQKYGQLTNEQINQLCKRKYTGWSRLSKKLLTEIKANDGDSIIDKLEKTNMNFMQIINEEKFGFNKKIEELMPNKTTKIKYQDIDEIPTSPANKRAIWQSICVVKEIVKIMKKEPQNIYIEFARSEEYNKKLTNKRAKQLLDKYQQIEEQIKYLKDYDRNVYKQLKNQQSEKMLTEKMYLYYIQNGKCLYSGKKLDLDNLSLYEVDHIIPRSYIKDDSIDNKALVLMEQNQRKINNLLLSEEIIKNQENWWKSLLSSGLISQSKYNRLTRTKMFETEADKEKFVKRQLVETRQITKYVTNLLNNEYKNTKIYSLRAELTHGFREKYDIYKNRNVNNYHHAQDAYIISTVGNILNKEWKGSKAEFKYGEFVKKYMQSEEFKRNKYGIMIGFINNHINIEEIKKVINYKDCFISRMLQEETGEFYDQTLYSPNSNKKNLIPLKSNKDVKKYGGYSGERKAYFVIYSYTDKEGKDEFQLIGIPIKVKYDIDSGKNTIENYIKNTYLHNKDYSNFKIIRNKILKNQEFLDENNERMRFCSDDEIRVSKELIIDKKIQELVYVMNNINNRNITEKQIEKLKSNYTYLFEYLTKKIYDEYKVFSNEYKKLINKKEIYKGLKDEKKRSVINALIDLMENGQGKFKVLGLSDQLGRKNGKNFNTEKLLNITFIDKSITGMYERRFKINGMENSSC